MRDVELLALQARLRQALGLAPLALAATMGCADPHPMVVDVPTEPQGDSDDPAVQQASTLAEVLASRAAAPAAEGTVEVDAYGELPYEGPLPAPDMRIQLDGGEWVPKHVHRVAVHGVPPDTLVSLVGGLPSQSTCVVGNWCFDMEQPVVIMSVYSNLDGVAHFEWLLPLEARNTPGGELTLQAIAHLKNPRISPSLTKPVVERYTQLPALAVLNPQGDINLLVEGRRYRACVPKAPDASCDTIDDFHEWQRVEIASYALDRPVPPTVGVAACDDDAFHPVDCCYSVEFFENTVDGVPEDACAVATVDNDYWGWGRPFAVADDAKPRLAPIAAKAWSAERALVPPTDAAAREAVAAAWRKVALAEHASVASFARFQLELLALGAPAHLLTQAAEAMADEIRHAELAFAVTSALSGQPEGPGPLPIDGALARSTDAESVLLAAIVEGCVYENIPAHELEWLEADLASTDLRTIVFAHQRLDVDNHHGVKNNAAVRTTLERSNKVLAVFQGHSHRNDLKEINDIHYCTMVAMVEGSGEANNGYSMIDFDSNGHIHVTGFRKQSSYDWPS